MISKIINEFKNTGERPVLEKKIEEVLSIFAFAYEVAADYVNGKTVLDIGCGGGYGTEYMSRFTNKKVVGFDIDRDTTETNRKYFQSKSLVFTNEMPEEKFDVITVFQVIEHIKERNGFYKKLKNLLNKDGVIIISTPNKNLTSYGLNKPIMVFHEIEFEPNLLKTELDHYFNDVKIYGQIDKDVEKLVKKGKYDYKNQIKSYSRRTRMIRCVSQMSPIRMISRRLPMFIKYIVMGNPEMCDIKFSLVSDERLVNNSASIIAIVRNG